MSSSSSSIQNMKYQYLSIDIKDKLNYINNYLIKSIELINLKFPSTDLMEISNFLKGDKSEKYSLPNTFHITTYFKEKSKTKKDQIKNKAIDEFILEKHVKIVILGYIVILNGGLIAIVNVDEHVNNQFPHITSVVGGFKPYYSNVILEEVSKLYVFKGYDNNEDFIDSFSVLLDGKSYNGYIILYHEYLEVDGYMNYH